MTNSLKDDLAAFQSAVAGGPGQEQELDPAVAATGALEFFLEHVNLYEDSQLGTLYEHLVGEIAARGLEEEILGDVPDAAGISLDEEMNEMIKLVRRMRANLGRQTALGRTVSNREIRETLSACVTTIKALTSHQKSVRTLERQRILENTLIEVLGESDEEMQIEFQRRLRERLEEVNE